MFATSTICCAVIISVAVSSCRHFWENSESPCRNRCNIGHFETMLKQSSKGYMAPTAASAVAQAGEGGAFPQPLSTADMDVAQPFAHLVRLLGRCFYNDVVIRDEVVIRDGDDDNCGLAVTILDNLTRFAWVKENELAKMLNIKQKNMIVLLQFLEKEKLLKRELIKRAQVKTIDAVAKKENGTFNMLAGAYCCSDYSQVVDVTRYQLHHMKESLKEKPDCSTMIEDYMCCICKRSYSALDAVHLISNTGNTFRCESCKGELVAQSGDYTSRRESRAKSANMLKSLKEEWKPIELQLNILNDVSHPDFRTVEQWLQTNMIEFVADSLSNKTKVEIPLPNSSAELDGAKFDSSLAGVKVLPMWIVQKGMAEKGEQGSDKNERRLGMKAKRSDGASCGDTYAKKQVL